MTNTHHANVPSSRLTLWAAASTVGAFIIAAFVAHLDVNGIIRTGLVSDVNAYSSLGNEVLNGGAAYTDVPIEHLPLAFFPILVLTAAARATGLELWMIWVPVMGTLFVASVVLFDRIGSGNRYLLLASPLLPLVLFRVEPWVVFLAVAALVAYSAARYASGTWWTVVGVLTKGWPITLAAIPWAQGRRQMALATVAISTVLLALVFATPGFREAREFSGIHSETVIGSLLLAARQIVGSDLGIIGAAGAVYVTASVWAIVINALPGVATIGASALALARLDATPQRRSTFDTAVSVSGLAVLGIMLTSPLLSTQFLFWLVPFIALERRTVAVPYIVGAVAGLLAVTVFSPTAAWWAGVVVAKNVAILALAWRWATLLLKMSPTADGTDLSAGRP